MATKRRPLVGDEAWHVDWCASVPLDECGDADLDQADNRTEIHWTKEAAEARAREVLPLDAFGSVAVTPVVFEPYDEADAIRYPHAGYWEPTGESEHFESE